MFLIATKLLKSHTTVFIQAINKNNKQVGEQAHLKFGYYKTEWRQPTHIGIIESKLSFYRESITASVPTFS